MKTGVIIFPGSNCDRDMLTALRDMSAGAWGEGGSNGEILRIWHADTALPKLDLVVVPGGFSYGDYLRSGAMAARAPIMRAVREHAAAGGLLLGVCNGFQILTEMGLLPGALMRNSGLHFVCKTVHLRIEQTASPYTRRYTSGQVIDVPIAHHDGSYFADEATLDALEGKDQVLFRYCTPGGGLEDAANPNGSRRHIAGICSKDGRIAGMMPHPERACDPQTGGVDGRNLFLGAIAA